MVDTPSLSHDDTRANIAGKTDKEDTTLSH